MASLLNRDQTAPMKNIGGPVKWSADDGVRAARAAAGSRRLIEKQIL